MTYRLFNLTLNWQQRLVIRQLGYIGLCCALLCAFAHEAMATVYYVSAATGSNTYSKSQAQSISTPWKTIQTAANNMVAGDTCLIQSGTYRETVTIPNSGTVSAPITFKADVGQTVTVSGTEVIGSGGWTLEGTNTYYAPMVWTMGEFNQVFQAGTMRPEARWPNANTNSYPFPASPANGTFNNVDWSYLTSAGSYSGTYAWAADTNLPARADGYWNGCTLRVMTGLGWYMKHAVVSGYSAATKTLTTSYTQVSPGGAYTMKAGNEYYITGQKGELDSNGEWFYSTTNSRLYYYSSTGAPTGIEAKKRSYGFVLNGRSYINLTGMRLFACTIQSDTTTANCTFDTLNMRYLGHCASGTTSGSINGVVLRNGFVLRNSDLGYDSRYLVQIQGGNIRIINNNLHDACYVPEQQDQLETLSLPKMGGGLSAGNLISHNSIHDAGRGLMGYCGSAAIIEYNDLYNGMKLTTDGGLFNTQADSGNSIFCYNLIHESAGPTNHTGSNGSQGFYLDSLNCNWIIHHNIIWNITGVAMQLNMRHNYNLVFNNTFWNTTAGELSTYFDPYEETGTCIFNNLFGGSALIGAWSSSDLRFNDYGDAVLANPASRNFNLQAGSVGIDQGTTIPGVTDGYLGASPDMGALEYGSTDWTSKCGYSTTPPSPDPTYSYPTLIFSNKVKDGGFESGSLDTSWTTVAGSVVSLLQGNSWTDSRIRTRYFGAQFGQGTSEIKQTITGLQPGKRYRLYGGFQYINPLCTVKLGVRNCGTFNQEIVIPPTTTATWAISDFAFYTGGTNSTAEVYVDVITPAGVTDLVYVDDIGVMLSQWGDGPWLHYSLDERSGTKAADAVAGNQGGTLSGTTTWSTGIVGNGLSLNGSTGVLTSPSLPTPSEITVACWAKSNTATWNNHGFLVSKRPSFVLHPNSGTKNVRFIIYTGSGQPEVLFTAPVGFDITAWHHYVGTYDMISGALSIYVDGVLQNTVTTSGKISYEYGPILVGKDDLTGYSRYFNGVIDDVRIYNYPMAQSQITSLYSGDTSKVFHYKFDDGASNTTALDCTGHGLTGTVTNSNPATDWVTGKVQRAWHGNGTNSYVIVPALTTSTTAVTVCCWAKSDTATWNAAKCMVANRDAFILAPAAGTRTVNFIIYTTGGQQWVAYTPADITVWHHYLGTYDQATGKQCFYVDGILQSSATRTGALLTATGSMTIGKDNGAAAYFGGSIDDVRLYSRALNWGEILDLVADTQSGPYSN